ncbi:hypothetical protein AWW70_00130 [Bacillus mycoides]|uniref:Uncharacterized protein n=2 Tax=Bacillus mycoides TaxID=1405 RepID=A0A109GK64_BACMY|nr:hypothetical protein AWW70_00130 [Bacillus mycoides]
MPFKQTEHDKSKELTVQVNVDNTKALEGIKEVTEVANECVNALEKLDKVMSKFTGKSEPNGITLKVPTTLDGKTISEDVSRIKPTANTIVSRTC